MAAQLFSLGYSPGLKRDGTMFQSKYCIDGKWVRFHQKGKIRKIGGMKGAPTDPAMNIVTKTMVFPWKDGGESVNFICGELGISAQINSPDWVFTSSKVLLNLGLGATQMWEAETVTTKTEKKTYVLFMLTHNANDINEGKTEAIFYRKDLSAANTAGIEANPMTGVNPLITGGLVFSDPYLFLYGSNGLVQYSKSNDPFTFDKDDLVYLPTPHKVIYGRPTRGGDKSPTLLFWTTSTVVRLTNQIGDVASFKPDIISSNTSILSSKCVIEYDGLFFWPGTDRFFVYNGIVQELDNNINLDYFFDNIDMDRRQQVFGVENTRYGEMWWFYPVKDVPGANSRAIIYNKRENTWYDTDISRTAGVFSGDFGFMSTYGKFLEIAPERNPEETNLWKHEVGSVQDGVYPDGQNITPIISSFTTPIFSWAAFPPNSNSEEKAPKLVNRWVDLQRIEPDFVVKDGQGPTNFTVAVNTQEYAQSKIATSDPTPFTAATEKLDMRVQGRNMSLTFSSDNFFQAGNIVLLLGVGDAR